MLYSARLLWRDWRSGELRLLLAALVVAVAAVTAVAWLAERVGGAAAAGGSALLAADRLVRSQDPIPEAWLEQADALGLRAARTAVFPSVVVAGERTQLVSLKAAEPAYPLRGELRMRSAEGAPEQIRTRPPAPGSIWIEPRLATLLDLKPGDDLKLGQARLRIAGLLTLESDRDALFANLAPRVMLNWADLDATGLIQPASRVRYALLLAGPEPALERFTSRIKAQTGPEVEVRTPEEARPAVREVVNRARRFLGLAALLTVVVAGAGMLITARHYAERQVLPMAVMRCLGATQARLAGLLVGKLVWLALAGGAAGAALGFVLHWLMLDLVRDLLPAGSRLPPPGVEPLVTGGVTALAALAGFVLPTLLRLRRVPPQRVLRQDAGDGGLGGWGTIAAALAAVLLWLAWQARDPRLLVYVAGAVLVAVLALGLAAAGLIAGLRWWRRRRGGGLWFSGLTRRPRAATVQVVGVGLGLMGLFLLAVVRTDLLDAWRDRIPDQAPNQFLINIQPEEVPEIRALLAESLGEAPPLYPMIRGRLVASDGEAVAAEDYANPRARNLVRREFNLSTASELATGNRIAAGQWWEDSPDNPDQWSVETGIAETLGLELGDRLTFDVGGREVSAEVTNLRTVNWDSFRVNFFVVAPPALLEDYPATWITSFYLPPEQEGLISRIVRQHPSVTVFDVSAILRTVRGILEQGTRVVELMAALTLVAGLVVLLAALQVSGEQRRFEQALLRSLGATRARIRRMLRLELILVGLLAGGLAGGLASLAGWAVADGLFDLPYQLRLWPVAVAAAAGALLVWGAGEAGARRYYRGSPMALLRQAED